MNEMKAIKNGTMVYVSNTSNKDANKSQSVKHFYVGLEPNMNHIVTDISGKYITRWKYAADAADDE